MEVDVPQMPVEPGDSGWIRSRCLENTQDLPAFGIDHVDLVLDPVADPEVFAVMSEAPARSVWYVEVAEDRPVVRKYFVDLAPGENEQRSVGVGQPSRPRGRCLEGVLHNTAIEVERIYAPGVIVGDDELAFGVRQPVRLQRRRIPGAEDLPVRAADRVNLCASPVGHEQMPSIGCQSGRVFAWGVKRGLHIPRSSPNRPGHSDKDGG